MKSFLIIWVFCFIGLSGTVSAQRHTGAWNGVLILPGGALKLVLHIDKNEGGYIASLDSPYQSAIGIPVDSVRWKDEQLRFVIRRLGVEYTGKLNEKGEIEGTFEQMGYTSFLLFVPGDGNVRYQEPKEPYPYRVEEVFFENKKDSVRLAGTLTLPEGKRNFPVVVLISGSGPQNRDEEMMGHKPFWILADYLTRQGIGVLRVDDRGVGASTGNFGTSSLWDFASDADAAVNFLRRERKIRQIGLVGHSEGGCVAPIVADRNKHVSFIVLLAGPGIRGDQLILLQKALIGKAYGMDPKLAEKIGDLDRTIFNRIIASDDPEKERDSITALVSRFAHEHLFLKPGNMSVERWIQVQVDGCLVPSYTALLRYDPYPILKKVKCPVLALNGEKDLQVPADVNLEAIRKALTEGKNKRFEIKKLPGLNHLFQECTTGTPREYGVIEQTFSPLALEEISKWILSLSGKK
ncbi:alpha/beta hydrolase [uncultured Sanguibacteroides sp.]|uniref:alpha/beta hydrolase family protein n=1 Tax=uncultured Sanguibacteroides sp. TaxID=1635151 RepID=UPI0025CEB078|nr:alpha/beta hydrolase [uncultured Sanguibacteroides sp.]